MSISAKIFAAAVALLLLILVVQMFFIKRYFDSMYLESMISAYQGRLAEAASRFEWGDDKSSSSHLRQFEDETGSPVLVINSHHQLADRQLMSMLPSISVYTKGGDVIKVLTSYLDGMEDAPYFNRGLIVDVSAVQVGESNYYEPLAIGVGGFQYPNRDIMKLHSGGVSPPSALRIQGVVTKAQSALEKASLLEIARLIYLNIRDCMVNRSDIRACLDTLAEGVFTDSSGIQQRFFYVERVIGGESHYFITVHKIFYTGQEQSHFARFFRSMYIFLGIAIIASCYFISRYFSRPLVRLSSVTRKIAALEFEDIAVSKSGDELGQLSQNINIMSQNLRTAMEELRQANQRATVNEQRMKSLLGDIAHEFKTPLGIISSYLELYQSGFYQGTNDEFFATLDDEITRLSDMVSEAIQLSRLQSGSWSININTWELDEIIHGVLGKLSAQLDSQGFTVRADILPFQVLVDARRIEQVLTNILVNAIKYSDQRRIITVHMELHSDDEVFVYIGNSGHLTASEKDRIWDRYYSTRNEARVRLPSEGIGLDIVKSILVSHQSKFGVTQTDDMVYFYFSLALDKVPPPVRADME